MSETEKTKLVALEQEYPRDRVVVNIELIQCITKGPTEDHTKIWFEENDHVRVFGKTPEHIIKKIQTVRPEFLR